MENKILFSLEKCIKCTQTKDLLTNRTDIKIVTYPHDIKDWDENQLKEAENHQIFDDLQITAPILWIDGEKIIGYLRIRKWLQENTFE
jgi:glutaredoxin